MKALPSPFEGVECPPDVREMSACEADKLKFFSADELAELENYLSTEAIVELLVVCDAAAEGLLYRKSRPAAASVRKLFSELDARAHALRLTLLKFGAHDPWLEPHLFVCSSRLFANALDIQAFINQTSEGLDVLEQVGRERSEALKGRRDRRSTPREWIADVRRFCADRGLSTAASEMSPFMVIARACATALSRATGYELKAEWGARTLPEINA